MPESRPLPFKGSESIRGRMLWAFALLVLLPTTILSLVLVFSSAQGNRLQLQSQLQTVLNFKEAAIDEWLNRLRAEVGNAAIGLATLGDLAALAQPTSQDPEAQAALEENRERLQAYLQRFAENTSLFDELILLDEAGKVLLATGATPLGSILSDQPYFQPDILEATVLPPAYSESLGYVSFFAVSPVFTGSGERVGTLIGRVNKMPLNQILQRLEGLGETGETYLVGRGHLFLNLPRYPVKSYINDSDAAVLTVDHQQSGSSTYVSYRGVRVLGVYRWLPQLQAGLVAEQELSESLRATYAVVAVNISIGLASLLIAMVAAIVITGGIATPVADLADTAVQVSRGDLSLSVEIDRKDEIGALAQAFNSMTAQLRQTLEGLERQVAERTFALEQRSAYLQASADVSRAVATILEPDQLIQEVVNLIRDRFGLYYVGLFQLDETGEWAVLRAGTGEAGRAMVGRGHRIRRGVGMIGWCVANAQPRIALEATEDRVRLRTPELPETRSEAALPLRSRGRVIGALSIQSALPNAFNDENIAVYQIMADQVAVAIENARLYAESQQALRDLRHFYTEQSLELWRSYLQRRGGEVGIRSSQLGVALAPLEWREEMQEAFWSGEPVQKTSAQGDRYPLAVPIKSRDVVIGVLDTYKPAGTGSWTEEEIRLLADLADQLGVALETAQFFSETRERAEMERLIGEITARMRQTLDIDQVMKTAARELQRLLDLAEVEIHLSAGTDSEELLSDPASQETGSQEEIE